MTVRFVDTDPRPLRRFVVTYTSMVIEATDEEAAIERAGDFKGGGNWEAEEIQF